MSNVLAHGFVSLKPDGPDGTQVQPSHWNAGHKFTGGVAGDLLTRDPADLTYGAGWTKPGQWTIVSTTATGVQHDFDPGIVGNTIIRASNAAALTITGFKPAAGVYAGQRVRVIGRSTGQVDCLNYQGSTLAYRLANNLNGARSIQGGGGGYVEYMYSTADQIWFIAAHDQGPHIRIPYSAARYTTSGEGGATWGVAAGDEITQNYVLIGNTLIWIGGINTATITGAPSSLNVAVPAGYSPSQATRHLVYLFLGSTAEVGTGIIGAAAATMQIYRLTGTFAAATDTAYAYWNIPIQVQ